MTGFLTVMLRRRWRTGCPFQFGGTLNHAIESSISVSQPTLSGSLVSSVALYSGFNLGAVTYRISKPAHCASSN